MEDVLRPHHDVRTIEDGEAALEAARSGSFDLVLADAALSDMGGATLLQRLRSDARTSRLPVIILLARTSAVLHADDLETGADDYVVAPFAPFEVLARVRVHLALVNSRRQSEDRMTRILDSVNEAFEILDADWRVVYLNPEGRRRYASFGVDPETIIGKHKWRDVLPRFANSDAASMMARAMRDREAISFELYFAPLDTWFLCRIDPLPDGGLACSYQDINSHMRSVAAARESERRLAAELDAMARLQEVSTRLVVAGDATSLLLEILDAAISITGADMGAIQLLDRDTGTLQIVARRGLDDAFCDFFNADHTSGAACGRAVQEGRRVVVEDVTTSPIFVDTPSLDVLLAAGVAAVQSTPLIARSGVLVGMLSTHYRTPRRPVERDLSLLDTVARQAADWIERTQAEQALRDTKERFRSYFELGLVGVAVTSPTKGCLEVNDRMCAMLGYSREELISRSWTELTHPGDLLADTMQFDRVVSGEIDGYSLEKRLIRKDRAVIDTAISVKCVRRPDRSVDYFVGVVQDITDRKRVEAAIRESEERYRSLISHVRDYAIFATSARGTVTTWNEGCAAVLGYGRYEFLGLATGALFQREDRHDGTLPPELAEAAESGTARIEQWMVAKDGRRFFAMGTITALRDAAGVLTGFSAVLRDLTQMKQSHDALAHHGETLERLVSEKTDALEKTKERLRLSERMASLGTLSAGLGHDIGNLLFPLDVRVQLLLRADLPPELLELVVGIESCAKYLQRLSNGLRLLAVDPWSARLDETTEIGDWWADVGMMLKGVFPRAVLFEHVMPLHPCRVTIGRVALTQAVFNLVQNAADAMRERGSGRVAVEAAMGPSGNSVLVQVIDDGPGMTEDVARRCMEPYFSTKRRSLTTGMGLPFVNALVTSVGGDVKIESTPGVGTTITLILPLAPIQAGLDDAGRPVALVAMRDRGLRTHVMEELRVLGLDIRNRTSSKEPARLVIVDRHAFARRARAGLDSKSQVIVVGALTPRQRARHPEVLVLGEHPDPDTIRAVLRARATRDDREASS